MSTIRRSNAVKGRAYKPSSELVPGVLAGSRPDIARMISRAESEDPEAWAALAELYRHAGTAHVIGITGVPGAGKSTLVASLIKAFSSSGRKVGVVAVDPSSPYSGGAILGDRVRMNDSAEAHRAYVRSMATRGHLGGLARPTLQAVDILDAAGFCPVFIETVGTGQDEVEIISAAHTVVVLSAPGLGDDIQAIKAGIMEIADIHAVSKADKPEAAATVTAIRNMMSLGSERRNPDWTPPVVSVSSKNARGIVELKQILDDHWAHLNETGEIAVRRRAICKERVIGTMNHLARRRLEGDGAFIDQLEAVVNRQTDPYSAALRLLHLDEGRGS